MMIFLCRLANWLLFIVLNGLKANPIHKLLPAELPSALAGGAFKYITFF